MKPLSLVLLFTTLSLSSMTAAPIAASPSVLIASQQAGPTPFISFLTLVSSQTSAIKSIQFTITPKPGSVTRAVSVTYSLSYLESRGYVNKTTGQIILPVFGLYANYSNTVVLSVFFTNGLSFQQRDTIPTAAFSDPCGYNNRTAIQARTTDKSLSYDYMLLKSNCGGGYSPTIMDTDGEIRWAGTTGLSNFSSTLFQNAVYLGVGAQLYRMELDGAVSAVGTYPISDFHHNIDQGKTGMIMDEDLPAQIESLNAEIDANGNVLKSWNLATIISNAMLAGGDNPALFILTYPIDWFHNNAVAYRKSDDSLAISSRENFVICIDYTTGAIKWILGDPTKQWYLFPSLRKYALALAPNTLPPIGQHAVSFTKDDSLLLMDDGQNSLNHIPPGVERTYTAPRKYQINLKTMTATEVWDYPNGQAYFSPYCSSAYEDAASNYLVDYSIISNLGTQQYMELLGLTSAGNKVFDYRYLTAGCNTAWNAIPIHLENMQFPGVSFGRASPEPR